MKKILFISIALLAFGFSASAQDMVEHNRAAVQEAETYYNEISARNNAKIDHIQSGLGESQQELARLQSELKMAKVKEKHLSKSLSLQRQKLNLQRKSDADQLSRSITKNEIEGFKTELSEAKELRVRLSREVDTMKKSISSDKRQISSLKKEISEAKKVLNQNEKTLKASEKLQNSAAK